MIAFERGKTTVIGTSNEAELKNLVAKAERQWQERQETLGAIYAALERVGDWNDLEKLCGSIDGLATYVNQMRFENQWFGEVAP